MMLKFWVIFVFTEFDKIIELLCDEIGLDSKIHIDQLFITVFDFDSREKAANFVVELKQRGVTLDWPLSITVN